MPWRASSSSTVALYLKLIGSDEIVVLSSDGKVVEWGTRAKRQTNFRLRAGLRTFLQALTDRRVLETSEAVLNRAIDLLLGIAVAEIKSAQRHRNLSRPFDDRHEQPVACVIVKRTGNRFGINPLYFGFYSRFHLTNVCHLASSSMHPAEIFRAPSTNSISRVHSIISPSHSNCGGRRREGEKVSLKPQTLLD